jgi:Flp pilus assembly protein TadG
MKKIRWPKRYMKEEKGQALLETALILPILLLLLIGIITFGMLLYSKIVVTLAASQSARLGATLYSKEDVDEGTARQKISDMANSYLSGLTGGSNINIEADGAPPGGSGEEVSTEDRQISVTVSHQFSMPLPFVSEFLNGGTMPIKYTAVYKIE